MEEKSKNIFLDRFVDGKFAQLSNKDGQRFLISLSPNDLRVYKLGFLSIFNTLLYAFKTDFVQEFLSEGVDPILIVVHSLLESDKGSKESIIQVCKETEEGYHLHKE